MIDVCTSLILGNECIVLDEHHEVVCCQNVCHPDGNMPSIWYVWFGVDSDGIHALCQSAFRHLLVNLDSYVFVVFMYLDVRDGIIMDNKSS